MVDFVDEGFDFVICIGLLGDVDLVVKLLCVYCMVICVLLDYFEWYGRLEMLVDLL